MQGIRDPQGHILSVEKEVRGMEVQELKRLKELEEENNKLKRMYADVSIQRDALKDLIEKKL